MKLIKFTTLVLMFLYTNFVSAAFELDKVVFKTGDWRVFRDIDPMSDVVMCTGIYQEDFGIQLTEDTLYIKVKGGLDTITLRFDDNPAENMKYATRKEKEIRSFIIRGSNFEKLINSSRLRVQISTILNQIEYRDLNLTGIKEVMSNISQGCPSSTSDSKNNQTCTDSMIQKFKSKNLTPEQIDQICK